MAVTRSPNYPQASLAQAIEDARKIWGKDGRNRISLDVAARHLGYTGANNGAAQVAISVLRKYGLLEGKGDRVGVTDVAITLMEAPPGSREHLLALRQAAFSPSLFENLQSEFPDSPPSLEAIRYSLIKRGFGGDAATRAARAYRETLDFLTASGARDGGAEGAIEKEVVAELATQPANADSLVPDAGATQRPSTLAPGGSTAIEARLLSPLSPGYRQDVFSLAEGEVVLRWPDALSKESFEDFEDWIQLVLRKVGRSAGNVTKERPSGS